MAIEAIGFVLKAVSMTEGKLVGESRGASMRDSL